MNVSPALSPLERRVTVRMARSEGRRSRTVRPCMPSSTNGSRGSRQAVFDFMFPAGNGRESRIE